MKKYQAARIAAKVTQKTGGPPPANGGAPNDGSAGKGKSAGGKRQPQQPAQNQQQELKPPEVFNSIQEATPKAGAPTKPKKLTT
eukprot:9684210-Karenia_brevis.AAC.1